MRRYTLIDGLQVPIKALFVLRHLGMVFVKDEVEKELVPIQVHGPSSHVTPEHRDVVGVAVGEVHLLVHILVETDAHVRGCRRNQRQGLPSQLRQGVIDELRFLPGNFAEVVSDASWLLSLFLQGLSHELGDVQHLEGNLVPLHIGRHGPARTAGRR